MTIGDLGGCSGLRIWPRQGVGLCTQLAYKIPAIFGNGGTHGHLTAFLAHFTYKSLFERLETGTETESEVI